MHTMFCLYNIHKHPTSCKPCTSLGSDLFKINAGEVDGENAKLKELVMKL